MQCGTSQIVGKYLIPLETPQKLKQSRLHAWPRELALKRSNKKKSAHSTREWQSPTVASSHQWHNHWHPNHSDSQWQGVNHNYHGYKSKSEIGYLEVTHQSLSIIDNILGRNVMEYPSVVWMSVAPVEGNQKFITTLYYTTYTLSIIPSHYAKSHMYYGGQGAQMYTGFTNCMFSSKCYTIIIWRSIAAPSFTESKSCN